MHNPAVNQCAWCQGLNEALNSSVKATSRDIPACNTKHSIQQIQNTTNHTITFPAMFLTPKTRIAVYQIRNRPLEFLHIYRHLKFILQLDFDWFSGYCNLISLCALICINHIFYPILFISISLYLRTLSKHLLPFNKRWYRKAMLACSNNEYPQKNPASLIFSSQNAWFS